MATLRLAIDARGARSGAREFTRSTDHVTRGAKSAATAVKGMVGAIATGFAVRTAGRIIGGYEERLVTLAGVARATEDQLTSLDSTARTLGATTRFSAIQTAEGLTFLARAGFDADEAIAAIPATLNLAQVGLIDLGKAADIASNVVSQFGLDATDTTDVVDALVIVSNRANTNILQLAEALKFAGPVAGALGNNVAQTSAALGVLGDRGLQGTLAGTALRTSLIKLADPSTKAREVIERLGLSVRSLSPEVNDIVTVFGRLGAAQATATDLAGIFGARQAAAAIILSRSVDRIRELEEATRDYAGEADDLARLQDDTLSGSFKSLVSAAEELVLALGDAGVGGAMRTVTDVGTDVLRVLAGVRVEGEEASGAARAMAFAIKFAAGSLAALAAIRAATFLTGLVTQLTAATAATTAFSVATGTAVRVSALSRAFTALTGPIGLAVTAAGLAAAVFLDLGDEAEDLEERLGSLGVGVSDITGELDRLADTRARIAQADDLGDLEGVAEGARAELEILNDVAVSLRRQLDELGGAAATTDLAQALELGLDADQLDFLARSARLELRNAFAAAAEDGLISQGEVDEIKATLGTLFDDSDDLFGSSVDDFLDGLRTQLSSSGQGIGLGATLRREIDPDALLAAFEQRFDQARVRTTDVLDLINSRLREVGEVAGDAGQEAEQALGEDLSTRLEEVRQAVNDLDLEGSLASPTDRLRDTVNAFTEALAESGVELDATSTAVTTLERALEALGNAEDELAERRSTAREDLEAIRRGLEDEREEVGLSTTALNQLRLERELDAIASQGEIGVSDELRQKLAELRGEIDRGREVQQRADQAARSVTDSLADYASGASTAREAGERLFQAIQRQILDAFVFEPLQDQISSGIQAVANGLASPEADAGATAAGAAGDAVGDLAAGVSDDATTVTAMAGQTTALTGALAAQTQAIVAAILGQSAADSTSSIATAAATAFDGKAFLPNGSVGRMQNGGILEDPGIAKLADGALTTFAEKEPEAVMPLKRLAGGRLGVEADGSGGRGTTIINRTTINTANADSFRRSAKQEARRVRRASRL